MPPVTRVYTTACVITTLAVQLEIVSPFQLYFNPLLILRFLSFIFIPIWINIIFQTVSDLEACNNIFIFWNFWIQFLVQHDLHLPLLQNAGGRKFQRQISWFCNDVCVWSSLYDNLCVFCESPIPGTGIYYHARVCLGQEEPLHQDELLWTVNI